MVTVNTDEVAAWTKGMFMFNDEELEGILTKISRWYNAEIIYRDESLKRMRFWGIVSKHDKLSKVLNMLEKTNVVKFEIQGKQIIVNR
ncbi:fec operon regulator FecR [compost metagenome]